MKRSMIDDSSKALMKGMLDAGAPVIFLECRIVFLLIEVFQM